MPLTIKRKGWVAGFTGAILIVLGGLLAAHSEWTANESNQAVSTDSTTHGSMPTINQAPKPMRMVRHGQEVSVELYTEETKVQIASGALFSAWTFDGTVPGPVLYLQQGDHVTITLHNLDPQMSHSFDFHAALVAPNQAFTDVAPGKSRTIRFIASVPGVFLYHCATEPMALHIAQGMYGVVIVTPPGQTRPTCTIVQSEFYQPNDVNSVLNGAPTDIVFNGHAFQYVTHPIVVKVGQPVSVAFVNAGPNQFSAFHVVGTVLRDVQASGNPRNHLYDLQTYVVAPGDGALIHLRFDHPGTYTFVSHSMRSAAEGAMGTFKVSK